MRIRRAKFNDWCQRKGLSPETLRGRLDKIKAIKELSAVPAPSYGETRTVCYDIDLGKLGLTGEAYGDAA